jgi:hypothetical protein
MKVTILICGLGIHLPEETTTKLIVEIGSNPILWQDNASWILWN